MLAFESASQLNALVASPYHRISDEVTMFRQIPALDLGDLSLRKLVETVDAEYPLGLPYTVELSRNREGYYWTLWQKSAPRTQVPKIEVGSAVEGEIDEFFESFIQLDEKLIKGFRHPRRTWDDGHDTVGLINFSHPAARNWKDDYPDHLDGELEQIAVVAAFPKSTEIVDESFTVRGSNFKQLMQLGSPTPPVQAVLDLVAHESIEEHAVAFSTDGTFHRKHNFTAAEDEATQSRALFRSVLQQAA